MKPDTWLLDLPFDKPLSLNDRMHHMVKAAMTAQYRTTAGWVARAAKIPPCAKIRTTLYYTPRVRRGRDPINLTPTLKVVEDALVDAGVVPNDTPEYVTSMMPMIRPVGTGPQFQLLVEKLA